MKSNPSSLSMARAQIIAAMTVFGTIGIFVRYIHLPSSIIALVRGIIGAAFLLLALGLKRTRPDGAAIRKNLLLLCLSGAAIGFNWILLFEAYHYTTVATATLCYYFAPIFVTLLSPFLLGEGLTRRKILCVLAALGGMVLVSGLPQTGLPSLSEAKGILFGFGAAILYASVVLMNKKIAGIGAFDKTMVQLAAAAVVLLPYTLVTEDYSALSPTPLAIFLLVVVGVVHTGVCYTLYFASLAHLPAQTAALFSYIDPVVAILLSAFFLGEPMGLLGAVGAVLVLGSTLVSELPEGKLFVNN